MSRGEQQHPSIVLKLSGHVAVIEPDRFTVTLGSQRYRPVALDDGGTLVPPGAWLSRTFTYEVPEGAGELQLWAPGADVPVMLTLGEAPAPHGH